MRTLLLLLLAIQGDPAATRVLEKVRSARPSDESLAVYRHDWAPTWEEARARAEKEKRPIFLVVNTNITGPTNFYTGHCWASSDHVRGSSLAHPSVIEILRPFIVVAVTARNEDAMPAEVRELSRSQARERRSNIHCYVLDPKGALVGSFPPFAGRIPDFDPDRMGRTMREGIERATRGMELPKVEDDRKLHLPDIRSGVRVLLSLKGPVPQYRAAVVECVPVGDRERRALAPPERARSFDAAELRPWLETLMPPAIMEGMGGIKEISGTLTLEPSGLLGGEVRLVLDDPKGSACAGRLDGLVTWRSGAFATVRASFEGVFGKQDRMRGGTMDFAMKAVLESRPE